MLMYIHTCTHTHTHTHTHICTYICYAFHTSKIQSSGNMMWNKSYKYVKTQIYNIYNTKFCKYFTFYVKMLYKIHHKQLIISTSAMSEQEKFLNRVSVYSSILLIKIQIQPFHTSELWIGTVHYLMCWYQHSMMFSENLRSWHWSMNIVFIPLINTTYNWICLKLFFVICNAVH